MEDKNSDKFNNIFNQLTDIKDTNKSVFSKLDDLLKVCIKNTAILDEHHSRSTRLEDVVEKMDDKFNDTQIRIAKIQAETKAVQIHIKKMSGVVAILQAMPTVLKIIATVLSILSAGAGAYYTFVYLLK